MQMFVNSSRVRLLGANTRFAKQTAKGMVVLDAGAGKGPYRHLFDHALYEAADFAQLDTRYTQLDYVCDLRKIPVEDARYDRILFNQVLEHISEPSAVLAELYRVLKPGGEILCSCPLFYREHQRPYDYFRYTQYGLRYLFENAGFHIRHVGWLEGYFGTVAYQFKQIVSHLPASSSVLKCGWRAIYMSPLLWATRGLSFLLMGAYSRADLRWKVTAGMPKNYLVLAKKPG